MLLVATVATVAIVCLVLFWVCLFCVPIIVLLKFVCLFLFKENVF